MKSMVPAVPARRCRSASGACRDSSFSVQSASLTASDGDACAVLEAGRDRLSLGRLLVFDASGDQREGDGWFRLRTGGSRERVGARGLADGWRRGIRVAEFVPPRDGTQKPELR
jgi:hypothetical protein